jgi:molecular chaperone DnaJ
LKRKQIVRVQINPIESYKGDEKTIQYMKDTHCNVCSGAGGEQQKCGSCNGQGFFMKSFGTGFMTQQVRSACPTCGGRGYTLVHKCYGCDGRGTKQTAADLRFMIPKGVDSGQYLKIERAGDFKNGEYGDLVGELRIDSPKVFDTSKPLRLRGKGYNGGDMYLKLNVKFERTN